MNASKEQEHGTVDNKTGFYRIENLGNSSIDDLQSNSACGEEQINCIPNVFLGIQNDGVSLWNTCI